MTKGRIVIIPFLHGKLATDGTLVEPDIDDIRQCTRDLLLVERAREWLLEDEAQR